jgi:hypothetical protein
MYGEILLKLKNYRRAASVVSSLQERKFALSQYNKGIMRTHPRPYTSAWKNVSVNLDELAMSWAKRWDCGL